MQLAENSARHVQISQWAALFFKKAKTYILNEKIKKTQPFGRTKKKGFGGHISKKDEVLEFRNNFQAL